jgi:hypothetical protein
MKTKLFKSKNEETIKFPLNKFFLGGGRKKAKNKNKNKLQASKYKAIRLCVWRVPGPKIF